MSIAIRICIMAAWLACSTDGIDRHHLQTSLPFPIPALVVMRRLRSCLHVFEYSRRLNVNTRLRGGGQKDLEGDVVTDMRRSLNVGDVGQSSLLGTNRGISSTAGPKGASLLTPSEAADASSLDTSILAQSGLQGSGGPNDLVQDSDQRNVDSIVSPEGSVVDTLNGDKQGQEIAKKRGRGRQSKVAKEGNTNKKLGELNSLLQKAAAYSTFLRERLLQSQTEGQTDKKTEGHTAKNSTVGGQPASAAADAKDPRQPKLVTGATMRGYQLDGVQWLISLYENGLNGILGDEMGLGKTLQVIALLAHLWEMRVRGPFLVVAPLSTIGNWVREFERFAPSVPVVLYHGTKDERVLLRKKFLKNRAGSQGMPVVVTSFEVAMNDVRYLGAHTWKYLCVDEGQRLKNKDCRLLRDLKSLKAANRLLLSGTPLQNNLTELWSLLNFILPDIFDSLSVFQTWFNFDEELADANGGVGRILAQEEEGRVISKLHAILDPFLLRRLKADVEIDLPDKHVYVVFAGLTEEQLRYNKAIAEGTLHDVLPGKDESSNGMANSNPSSSLENVMMQMRKCCNHPYLFEAPVDEAGDWIIDNRLIECSGKMKMLDNMLTVLRNNGHKTLIFFQMTRMMDIVEDYLTHLRKWKFCRLDGAVSFQDRQDRLKEFTEDPDCFCFLLSTRAGGLGISLPVADTVIFYDSDFNPQQDLQAQDRCHRIGQTKHVAVYRLITRDSVEVKIYERTVTKRKLELMTINPKRFKVAEKLQGSTDLRNVFAGGNVEVKNTFTIDELKSLLKVNVQSTNDGLISQQDLESILLRRGEDAATASGQGWELVDMQTSSFVRA